MSIEERQREYCRLFRELSDPDSQLDQLFSLGVAPPEKGLRRPENRLAGCRTAIWFTSWKKGEKVFFQLFSESLLVNGVCAIYRELYQGETGADIQKNPPRFLEEISDRVIYPDVKRGGLWTCYKQLAAQ